MKSVFKIEVIGEYLIIMTVMTSFRQEGIFEVLIVFTQGLCDFHGFNKFGLVLFAIFAFSLNSNLLGLI